jgi:RND family efflux transporter MFP subunit
MKRIQPTRGLLGCLLLVALASGSAGCQKAPAGGAPPAPAVDVAQPVRRTITLFNEHIGSTRAYESVEIRARVSGELERIAFEPSRLVEKGDLLFVIEPRSYKAARDEAFAALKSAEAELARAESDLERVSIAIQTDAVSQSDLDLAKAQRDKAEAAVLSARASLDQAELQYSYTQVRTPITGQVGRNLVDVGNVVGAGERTLLTTVNRVKPIFVYFDAPEEVVLQALRMRGTTVQEFGDPDRPFGDQTRPPVFVSTLADEGYPFEGELDFVGNTVDPDTGTIQLRAVLANEDLQLFPGLFVRVRVPVGDVEDAILIDEKAVGTDLGGRFLYLVGADNLVEQRYVELGPVQEDGMVPIMEGLEGDETYIVDGMLRARPGMPVTPERAAKGS